MKWLERSLLGKCREMCVAGRYIDWVVESVGFFFFFFVTSFYGEAQISELKIDPSHTNTCEM